MISVFIRKKLFGALETKLIDSLKFEQINPVMYNKKFQQSTIFKCYYYLMVHFQFRTDV